MSAVRMRPPGDLKLARSLSKSDSDLLVSPPSEEEGGLGNRSESVSNCSTGKKRLEKSPSFTSEWDEVSVWSHRVSIHRCKKQKVFSITQLQDRKTIAADVGHESKHMLSSILYLLVRPKSTCAAAVVSNVNTFLASCSVNSKPTCCPDRNAVQSELTVIENMFVHVNSERI